MMKTWALFLAMILVILLSGGLPAWACSGANCGGACGDCTGRGLASDTTPLDETKVISGAAVTTPTLQVLLKSGMPLTLVDCRSGACADDLRLPSARSLSDEASPEEIARTVPDKNSLVILYDGKPECKARLEVSKRMAAQGYTNIIEYPGGIKAWLQAGNTLATGSAR